MPHLKKTWSVLCFSDALGIGFCFLFLGGRTELVKWISGTPWTTTRAAGRTRGCLESDVPSFWNDFEILYAKLFGLPAQRTFSCFWSNKLLIFAEHAFNFGQTKLPFWAKKLLILGKQAWNLGQTGYQFRANRLQILGKQDSDFGQTGLWFLGRQVFYFGQTSFQFWANGLWFLANMLVILGK